MKRLLSYLLPLLLLTGCVLNDIPYPVVVPHILDMKVEGAVSVTANSDKRRVDIVVAEDVDLRAVVIDSVSIDVEKVTPSFELVGTHDLTNPLEVTLSTYQDYVWTIAATRPVERYFTVSGQVGAAVIDAQNRRAIAYVNTSTLLSHITVTSLKLGPKDVTTYSKEITDLTDFSEGEEIDVTAFGVTENWHLFVEQTDQVVNITKKNIWTREAYLTADGVAGRDNGFKYRKAGDEEWLVVDKSTMTFDGGKFEAHITDLEPETEYEFYAYTGSDETDVDTFTTDVARQLPNNSFENFSIVTGKDYYKWYDPKCSDPESQDIWWACGNGEGPDGVNGTASLGVVLTFPDGEEKHSGNWSVRCESKNFAGLLACGNLFTGRFAQLEGTTGGSVYYGRPWTTRPRALRIWMKYNCGKIDLIKNVPVGETIKIGDPDRCEIAVSVGNWDYKRMGGTPESPVYVNTTKGIYYTSESKGVIGFGHLILDYSTDGWQMFEIPLEYKDLETIPTHLIITCAASFRGDYLTGSSQTTMWIDDFEILY